MDNLIPNVIITVLINITFYIYVSRSLCKKILDLYGFIDKIVDILQKGNHKDGVMNNQKLKERTENKSPK